MAQTPRPWFRKATGWWMAQVDRKQVKLAQGKGARQEAEKKLRELLTLRDLNPTPESGRLTVAAVIDLFLEHAKAKYSERTLYERKIILQSFAEAHGWRRVNDKDCLPFHLTSWMDANPQWKSDWTKNHVVSVVLRPFNWAARNRLIAANPFRGCSHRLGQPRRPMTDEEFNRLLKAADGRWHKRKPTPADRFRELLRFLRYTGARPSEASGLEWSDIDLENRVIVLKKHKTSSTQRIPKPRVIPLHPEVVTLLIEIRKRDEPGPRVFQTHRRSPWNRSNLSLRMRRARAKANIPDDAKLYGLRHAFATRSIVNGVDIKTLSELMGHTSTRTTEHYVHALTQMPHLQQAMLKANVSLAPPDATKTEAADRNPGS